MQRDQALESLNKFVGTWKATDPTGRGGISGQTRFEWMKGSKVLLQWVEFGGATGLEVIAYDKESQSLKSHYFDGSGGILEYVYAIDGDDIVIRIDMKGREGAFKGRFAPDGNSMSGEWNWTESGK
jgi:hypothetical protein